jgi:hypothetical protein
LDIPVASVVGVMTRFYDVIIAQFSLGVLPMRFWLRLVGISAFTILTVLGTFVPRDQVSADDQSDFVFFQDEKKKADATAKKGDAPKDGDTKTDPKKGTDSTPKKKVIGNKKEKPEVPKNPYVKLNTVSGKVAKFDEASNCLTIKVPVPYINNKKFESKDVDVKAVLTDDVKIRLMVPPVQYDEKGRPKRYTNKELTDLKGEDKKSPGFPGSVEDLQANAVVRVDLVRTKEDLNKLRRNKKDDPANELDRTNLIIVVSPGPPQ